MLFKKHGEGRLFRRVVLTSGVLAPGMALGTKEEAEGFFGGKLGIGKGWEEGLEKSREIGVEKIVEVKARFAEEGAMWRTVLAEEWFGTDMCWDEIPEKIGEFE